MKKSIVLACMVAVGVIAVSANAGSYTFRPYPVDVYDLEHSKYYAWKIDFSLPSGETIDSASLFFHRIRNNNNSPNVLYVSLLDGRRLDGSYLPVGLSTFSDNHNHSVTQDNTLGFSEPVSLVKYENLGTAPTDKTYDFTSSQIGTLNNYVSFDGDFGIGFDPDCHFKNSGITLTIETVPVPGAVLLGSIGLSCSGLLLRKRRML
jgi:hypothetical protein